MDGEIVGYMDAETGKMISPAGQTPSVSTPSFVPPISAQKTEKADILDKIRPDIIVESIRHKLMGEDLINGKWVKLPELQDRAISAKGAWDIANLMLPASSQNVSISRIKDHEIRARTLEIIKTAQIMMLKNWREYDITGTDQLEFVHQIIMTNTLITLKQPENGGIRDLIKGVSSESRVISSQEKGGGSWIPFRK